MAIDSHLEIAKKHGYQSVDDFLRNEAHYLTKEKQQRVYSLLANKSDLYK